MTTIDGIPNAKPTPADKFRSLADLLPMSAAKQPGGRVVAVCGSAQITWTELAARSARLASVLSRGGVCHQDRVGIYLHKSIESLVAVHGIFQAGAAYVPLDANAPASVTAQIIDDCEMSAIVTAAPASARLAAVLAETTTENRTLIVGASERDVSEVAGEGTEGIEAIEHVSWDDVDNAEPIETQEIDVDGLAYIMYTSGSTGEPKGIGHTHRSGLAYATTAAELYGLEPSDRMASLSPLHFDMSTLEFFAGVLAGATVVIVPEPYLKVPASLAKLLSDERCTTMYAVPSLFQQLLDRGAIEQRDFSALRWVLPAGEMFPLAALRSLLQHWPNATYSNIYGPAEVNQCSHFTFSDSADLPDVDPLPIGAPWEASEFKIVDEGDQPVPVGERGELLVATSTMMRGYWKRPDLDERVFVEMPNGAGVPTRWYRTGDVVSQRNDGAYVFYGRNDHQAKIRGHRVQLDMIEAAVAGMPGIAQAVVGPRRSQTGDSELVAYYQSAHSDSGFDEAHVRKALAAVLPPYGVPTEFCEVESFPTTPSGKIDRRRTRENIGRAE